MPATYEPLATTTLGSAAASVTFSSISGSYTDLVIVCNAKGSNPESVRMQFNSDTGTNYSSTILAANTGAGTATSARFSNVDDIRIGYYFNGLSTTDFLPCIIQIQNYSNSTTYKTALGRSAQQVNAVVGLWRSTSAITTVKLYPAAGNFETNSMFTLFGIKAA